MKSIRKLDDFAGKICEILIPVDNNYFDGKGKKIAICTLSSINLLRAISNSDFFMTKISIAARLLSENKGIDTIIKYSLTHPELKYIILCGKEVKGHLAGQALVSLYRNGIDQTGNIIGAKGPYPVLNSNRKDIQAFKERVKIIDMIGVDDIQKIKIVIQDTIKESF